MCGGFGFAEGTCDCEGSIAESGYNCDGSCVIDTDADGICDEFEITLDVRSWAKTSTAEAANDNSGHSVSLSSDGMTVAIGARYNAANG